MIGHERHDVGLVVHDQDVLGGGHGGKLHPVRGAEKWRSYASHRELPAGSLCA
jgi:hypothetical protein